MEENNQNILPTETEKISKPCCGICDKKSCWKWAFLAAILLLVISLAYAGYQFSKLSQKQTLPPLPTPIPMIQSSPTPTPDPTANWKTYNSPEIGDYMSPFQINYPPTWTIKEELNSTEPKSLTLTLTNLNNETIRILQGMGGGGNCIYYDDPDYTTFEGMGGFYSSYIQLNKPALWRISKIKDKSEVPDVVCEKSKVRYIDGTEIGWISIATKSEATLQEIKSILEKIVFKPTAKTKSWLD